MIEIYDYIPDYMLPILARLKWLAHRIRHPSHVMEWNNCEGDLNCLTCSHCFWMRCLEEED